MQEDRTPLMMAALKGNTVGIKALLGHKASLHAEDKVKFFDLEYQLQ